jgi:hypothetical protein
MSISTLHNIHVIREYSACTIEGFQCICHSHPTKNGSGAIDRQTGALSHLNPTKP